MNYSHFAFATDALLFQLCCVLLLLRLMDLGPRRIFNLVEAKVRHAASHRQPASHITRSNSRTVLILVMAARCVKQERPKNIKENLGKAHTYPIYANTYYQLSSANQNK